MMDTQRELGRLLWYAVKLFVFMLVFSFFATLATGCGAVYRYQRTADGCSLSIVSAREVQAGAVSIGRDCAVKGGADALTANEKALEAINALVHKIP